ncbi:MAG: mannose-1-phosphate guanylyltransferase [Flavobacteriales bacterium]
MKDNYCILMAGGIGSRFWPMSTEEFPKQFHDVLGMGKTLLQMSFDRMLLVCPKENIFIVTNSDYQELVQNQLPGINENQILLEPSRKNTAPCVAYASYKIKKMNPNATLVVAPSDHIVMNEPSFKETLDIALDKANSDDCLVTLGIKPSRPDTGYGYIQFLDNVKGTADVVRDVKMFTEKPNIELAKEFIDSGDFYWNAGIFVWTADSIINAFEKHMNTVHELFAEGMNAYNTELEEEFISHTYAECKNISIDYGIMEKAKNVFVVLSDFGWSDLGTWGALYGHIDKDENSNAVIGNKANLYDSKDCIVRLPKDKLAVIQGLEDYIVVEEKGVLLICKKEEEQRIKEFVTDLKQKKR